MPLKYNVFENFMENRAFAPKEQMLEFPYYYQKYPNLYLKCSCFFSMLSKNRKWYHDLKLPIELNYVLFAIVLKLNKTNTLTAFISPCELVNISVVVVALRTRVTSPSTNGILKLHAGICWVLIGYSHDVTKWFFRGLTVSKQFGYV